MSGRAQPRAGGPAAGSGPMDLRTRVLGNGLTVASVRLPGFRTAAIGAFYLVGTFDLERFRRATASVRAALGALDAGPVELAPWLDRLDPSLRPAVRRRIEGEPSAMPGPALAPYIAGLLVLLGMLGTFLGMVLTLRGTGIALENATDLQAVRGSLVAPVKGLGLAFGTSVAGVATSAMLGLLSALARRDRAHALRIAGQSFERGRCRLLERCHRHHSAQMQRGCAEHVLSEPFELGRSGAAASGVFREVHLD